MRAEINEWAINAQETKSSILPRIFFKTKAICDINRWHITMWATRHILWCLSDKFPLLQLLLLGGSASLLPCCVYFQLGYRGGRGTDPHVFPDKRCPLQIWGFFSWESMYPADRLLYLNQTWLQIPPQMLISQVGFVSFWAPPIYSSSALILQKEKKGIIATYHALNVRYKIASK